MKAVVCSICGKTATTHTWFRLGWIKFELEYVDGNKWRSYTCKDCLNKPVQKPIQEVLSEGL
jgi:hypothetical protein